MVDRCELQFHVVRENNAQFTGVLVVMFGCSITCRFPWVVVVFSKDVIELLFDEVVLMDTDVLRVQIKHINHLFFHTLVEVRVIVDIEHVLMDVVGVSRVIDVNVLYTHFPAVEPDDAQRRQQREDRNLCEAFNPLLCHVHVDVDALVPNLEGLRQERLGLSRRRLWCIHAEQKKRKTKSQVENYK